MVRPIRESPPRHSRSGSDASAAPLSVTSLPEVVTIDGIVFAIGRSVCSTEAALDGPAIWTVRTEGDRVSEWRVFDDTPESRRQLGLAT
jgi:hypothetical protein